MKERKVNFPLLLKFSKNDKSKETSKNAESNVKNKRKFAIYPSPVVNRYEILVQRSAYTYDEVEEWYPKLPYFHEDAQKPFKFSSLLPIVSTIANYKWKKYLYGDLISGLSVAFLQMPQGLAYGLLASMSPVSGFYTSFFPVLIYIFFGTCPQISMGTNSVTALITAAMVEREVDVYLNQDDDNTTLSTEEHMGYRESVASASAFGSGMLLLLMGIFRVGFVTSYMPSSFVGGFTAGAAVHIVTSQVKHIFHIKIRTHAGVGKIIRTYCDVVKEIPKTNIADTGLCILSMGVLLLFNLLNPKIKDWRGYEVPINLIMIVVLTLFSHFLDFGPVWGMNTVGEVPFGVPAPTLPRFTVLPNIVSDVVALTAITFAMTISMAMLMAKIHNYDVDSNRELIAYGLCNLGSSFFKCQVSSVSPPRTMILSNTGAETMLNGVPTALFLFIMFFAGTLLKSLPIAYLAAMIIVAVKDLLLQFLTVPKVWKVSKADFFVWTGTWLVTVFADLPWGIITGMSISILGLVINNQVIEGSLIVCANNEDLLLRGEDRMFVHQPKGIRIFYFPSQLFFANAEIFKKQLFQNVFDPTTVHAMDYQLAEDLSSSVMDLENAEVKCIIIDCSAITYIDMDGVNMLKMVIILYRKAGIQILLARVPERTIRVLENGDFFALLPKSCVFHDVEDAMYKEQETRYGVSRLSLTFSTVLIPTNDPSSVNVQNAGSEIF
uniref:STAS domain-containing protein n=1 Tax=Biomphalaria glabrata TaxID=6526 RepID=A0A2C9KKB5_BIOGL